MNAIARPVAAATHCAHCAAPLPPESQASYCCAGCAGAHALVTGLGLEAFYARRQQADGAQRPTADAPVIDFTPLARATRGGEHSLELVVSGLTCGACVWLVEQALAAEPDVMQARASLSARRLTVAWRGPAERGNALVALVGRLGFSLAPWSTACLRATEDAEGRELLRALGIAAFGATNIMMLSVAVWVGWDMGEATRAGMHWMAALIGLPVVLVAGLPFYRSALAGLRAGRMNMDLAVSLGVLAATGRSLSETILNGPFTYFDSASTLLALLLAGRVADRAARRRARQAVAELLALQEGAVLVLSADGTSAQVPVEQVQVGARIQVAAGERLLLDAVLEGGDALLDTSATTGESLPRRFAAGEALPAGAVNMGAPFVSRVTAAAQDGSLATMARLLERAEQAKGHFVDLADRVVRWFVPVVHAVALATFFWWWLAAGMPWHHALVPAVATLIVTCPCGFAIAVPAVQVVAVGALFRRGVLVSSATALERLASADVAVLDKTGTLTEGRPLLLPGLWSNAQLRRAATLARVSRHPLARALARACPAAPVVEGVQEHPGQGLALGRTRLGSARFCGIAGEDLGLTLWLAEPGSAPVAFRFADTLRPDAAAAVAGLRALGLEVELLSGDAAPAVRAMAEQAGITNWRAGVSPEGKAARIQALRAAGRRPLMVGDGINDATALALAHVSAAPDDGTDLAQTAADMVLRAERLSALPQAIATARQSQVLARQNIGLSLAYNALAIPLAAFGFVTPLLAAVIMASSSIIVILNALRAGREVKSAWTA